MEKNAECRIGVISWPIQKPISRRVRKPYIILGEIRDFSKSMLSSLAKDIGFLYPFRWKGSIPDEFAFYREKYSLTEPRIVGNVPKDCVLRSPVLYDLSCMVPVFEKTKILYNPSTKKDRVVLVFSYENPIQRGSLLSNSLKLHPSSFFLLGSKSTKMYKYLLCQGYPKDCIVKMPLTDGLTTSILDSIEILTMMDINPEEIYIACLSVDVSKIRKHIQGLKYKGLLEDRKFFFVCEN